MFTALGVSLLLAFSYKIVESFFRLLRVKHHPGYILYTWVLIILIIIPLFNEQVIFNFPANITVAIPGLLTILLLNVVISRYSGYDPVGKFNILNFAITYPIVEEIIFRGIMLPYLNEALQAEQLIQLLYMPVNFSVIITAFLFAVAHLQYYKLSSHSIRYMIFAFIGGLFLGALADLTGSIMLTCLLHIQFNTLAIYYAKKIKK